MTRTTKTPAKKHPAPKKAAAKKDAARPRRTQKADPTLDFAMKAVEAALDKKGLAPTLLDLSSEGSYADYILVVSGRSDRHVQSVADGVKKFIKEHLGRMPIGLEGNGDGQWSLIDYGEVVVHVFYHPIREHYDLEGLWSEAPRIPLEIPPDSQLQYSDHYDHA